MGNLLPGSRPASVIMPDGDVVQGECQLFETLDLRDLRSSYEGTFATDDSLPLDKAKWLDVPEVGRFEIVTAGYVMWSGRTVGTELSVRVKRVDESDS